MKNGFPPAIVRNENRQDYYLALERADQGDSEALVAIIKEEVTRALKLLLSA
jgi:hypothetical protein